jgi:hypothetical protein
MFSQVSGDFFLIVSIFIGVGVRIKLIIANNQRNPG